MRKTFGSILSLSLLLGALAACAAPPADTPQPAPAATPPPAATAAGLKLVEFFASI